MYRLVIVYIILMVFLGMFQILNWPSKSGKVVFCDVGQGDAVLIVNGLFQVLIDTGPDSSVESCLSNLGHQARSGGADTP